MRNGEHSDARRAEALSGLARSLNRNASPRNVAHLQAARRSMGLPPIPGAVGNAAVPYRAEPLNARARAAQLTQLQAEAGRTIGRLAAKAATIRSITAKTRRAGRLRY